MDNNSDIKHILIIDKTPHWRKFSEDALAEKGYAIHLQSEYCYPPSLDSRQEPALVILGCATVGPEELELIKKIVAYKHHLMVFCTALPRDVMRVVFLEGVDDVVDRQYNVDDFVENIEQVLRNIEHRNIYQT